MLVLWLRQRGTVTEFVGYCQPLQRQTTGFSLTLAHSRSTTSSLPSCNEQRILQAILREPLYNIADLLSPGREAIHH